MASFDTLYSSTVAGLYGGGLERRVAIVEGVRTPLCRAGKGTADVAALLPYCPASLQPCGRVLASVVLHPLHSGKGMRVVCSESSFSRAP